MDRREAFQRKLMITFQAELEEHLNTLNRGLLALEEGALGADSASGDELEALLADLFRAAHSAKGAARAVGLRDIASIAHRLEDVLGAVQRGERSPTPELLDALFPALDAVEGAMAAHVQGESLPAECRDRVLADLEAVLQDGIQTGGREGTETQGHDDGETGRSGDQDAGSKERVAGPSSPPLTPSPGPPVTARPQRETIRVTTEKLDTLMATMGELLVARMRAEQHLAELRAIQERVIRWQRDWRQIRDRRSRLRRREARTARAPNALDAGYLAPGRPDLGPSDRREREVPVPALEQAKDLRSLLDFLDANEDHLRSIGTALNGLVQSLASDYNRLALLTDDLQGAIRQVRMVPVATLFDVLPRMVRDLARERDKLVTLQIEGAETEVDRQVLEMMKDPLIHVLRNAIDHGIEPPGQREAAGKPRRGTIRLRAARTGDTIVLEVSDDGAGIDATAVRQAVVAQGLMTTAEANGLTDQEAVQLIFRSGLSALPEPTDLSGRGVGLDVVRRNLERLHGLVDVETAPGQGTTFTMTLPLTMATSHVLLVEVADQTVAVPSSSVRRILRVDASDLGRIDDRPALCVDGRPLSLIPLGQVLELPPAGDRRERDDEVLVVVLGVAERRIAFRVDGCQATREVVVKSLGRQLSRVRNVAGATILGTGQVVVILNVADLMTSAQASRVGVAPQPVEARGATRRRVLVVDDSITTRTLERTILENAGYEVLVAADGQEAWALVQSEPLEAVVADIAMPRMDGFALTERVKGAEAHADLPVILVTSLESRQDRIRGLEAGADAYVVKSTFDQLELLEIIERLIG